MPYDKTLEAEIRHVASPDRTSYAVGDWVWCNRYPGVVRASASLGKIDVQLARGVVTVDPGDRNTVQPRDLSSPLRLDGRSFEVVRGGPRMVELRGARGGEYALVQNVHDQASWGLIPGGHMKPRVTWYRKGQDGSFTPIRG